VSQFQAANIANTQVVICSPSLRLRRNNKNAFNRKIPEVKLSTLINVDTQYGRSLKVFRSLLIVSSESK